MKNILITGASSGLGKNLFIHLSEKYPKSNFYLISRNPKLIKNLTKIDSLNVFFIKSDLANKNASLKILEKISNIRFDLIINNAGKIYNKESFQKNLYLNALTHFRLTYFFLKKRKKGKLNVINISSYYHLLLNSSEKDLISLFNKKSLNPTKAYAISKLYLITLSNYLEAKFFKRCNFFNIDPGIIKSNFTRDSSTVKKKIFYFIRKILGKNPKSISKEIVNIIRRNPKIIKSKILYNKFNRPHILTYNKEFQNKIFNLATKSEKKN